MEEYILAPEDSARIVGGEMIELFCDRRTMIFFAVGQLETICRVTGLPLDGSQEEALRFTGPDSLMQKRYAVLVPQSHPDYAALRAALSETAEPQPYQKRMCDHTGPRRH